MAPRTLNIKPDPDFSRFEKVLRRAGEPDRVPIMELYSNIEPAVLKAIGKYEEPPGDLESEQGIRHRLGQHITYQHSLGYDYVAVGPQGFSFQAMERPTALTDSGEISYITGDAATIAGWDDFENYAWPEVSTADFTPVEIMAEMIPDGMKATSLGPGGVLENVMWLMGYEGISLQIYDDEPLVQAMFDAIGTRLVTYFDNVASHDVIGAVVLGDDMGFKTQTMLSPDLMRKYVFPWQAKVVDAIHEHGKPAILHACGNLTSVMDDVIDCGWEARHSFEDAIEPVWDAKKTHGDRISLMGGFDMDKICRMPVDEVRKHTETLIERCAPGGGWALGTGNSVAGYVPAENFLAMLEVGFEAGVY